MSETLDRVLTALATSHRPHALSFCNVGGSLRLVPITQPFHFGDGLHFDGTGDSYAILRGTARSNPLDFAGAIHRVAHSDVFCRHRYVHPGTGLPVMPISVDIFSQVVPDANPASANVLG